MVPKEDAPRDGRVPAQGPENGAPGENRTRVRPGTTNAAPRTGLGNDRGGGAVMTPWLAIVLAIVIVPAGRIGSRLVSGAPPVEGGGSGGERAMVPPLASLFP